MEEAVVVGAAASEGEVDERFIAARLDLGAPDRRLAPAACRAMAWRVKRGVDVVGAVVLLVVLAPLLVVLAAAIALTSRGPALYRQERIGRGGVPFEMLKFRTMHHSAHTLRDTLAPPEGFELFKLPNDPRTTRVGRLLRRASLDELPQLVNVLRGEMSFVGPRPLIQEEDRLIGERAAQRLAVTPGMTGPWQCCGRARPGLGEMIALDCRYATRWSLWTDLLIIARTAWQVVRLQGM